jgi:hypothetical protein
MKSVVTGAVLLMLVNFAAAQVDCTDVADPTSELFTCISAFSSLSDSVCEDPCKSVLEDYGTNCPAGAAVPDALDLLCNPQPEACTNIATPGNALYECNTQFTLGSKSICEGDCKTALDSYADECLGGTAQAFKDQIETFCSGTTDPTCAEINDDTSDLYQCTEALDDAPRTACGDSCKTALEAYADECLGGAADAYKDDLGTFCANVSSVCGDFLDEDTNLYKCNRYLTSRSESACDSSCKSDLVKYADECVTEAVGDALKDSLNAYCDEITGSGVTVGSALLSTLSALLIAVAAAL